MMNYEQLFDELCKRYHGMTADSLKRILCPMLIPISRIDKTVFKVHGQRHWRASFEITISDDNSELMTKGRTGKFVPRDYVKGKGIWSEIAKGRIINVDRDNRIAYGEIYTGNTQKSDLETALDRLTVDDYLEIDQYGAAAKILSALVEHNLAELAKEKGYHVTRMPEDCAKHIGEYYNYDFEFSKNGTTKKIEVKSLWGTDTRYARLIHSTSKSHLTSSCKFETQDIFAVSRFLLTGNSKDFAFAKSVSKKDDPIHGLPPAQNHSDYVNQTPLCQIDNIVWFDNIDDVWNI